MQICAHCGGKNIDNLKVCWQCRQPLGTIPEGEPGTAPAPYRHRARGIRPSVGIAMILVFAAGIGIWLFLRSPESVRMPAAFAGQRQVLADQSRAQERLVAKEFDLSSGYAFYGEPGTSPRYRIAVFRQLHPPYTANFLLGDYQRYLQRGLPFVESVEMFERRTDGARYSCFRVPEPEGMLGEARVFEPYLWCSWRTREELGILVDLQSSDIGTTLRLTRRARRNIT